MLYRYIRLWLKANGTADYGKVIRWLYLLGNLSAKDLHKLDKRNYKKWRRIHNNSNPSFESYLEVAKV